MKGYIGQVGTNPCGEIILQSKQFCNLSEIIARQDDTKNTASQNETRYDSRHISIDAHRISATFLKIGKRIAKTRRFLASRSPVSGMLRRCAMPNAEKNEANGDQNQPNLRQALWGQSFQFDHVREALRHRLADLRLRLGIHPRHSQYYIRRIRITATDSLFKMLRDQGIPHHPEVGQSAGEANTYVLNFPVKAPKPPYLKTTSLHRAARILENAQAQLDRTQPFRDDFSGRRGVGLRGRWLYENWDIIGGLSFLPRDNHVYRLAPYESIDKATYERLTSNFPQIDYSKLYLYEKTDETEQAKELACAGGTCEIV
jgi:hypothetical protein